MQNCGILQTVWQQLLAVSGGEFHVKTGKRCKLCMAETVVKFPKYEVSSKISTLSKFKYQAGHSNHLQNFWLTSKEKQNLR